MNTGTAIVVAAVLLVGALMITSHQDRLHDAQRDERSIGDTVRDQRSVWLRLFDGMAQAAAAGAELFERGQQRRS